MKKIIAYYTNRIISIFTIFLREGNIYRNISKGENVKLNSKYVLINVSIESFSYVASNSNIRNTSIGKFCSIGPNFMCGLALHPINGISTSPFFYSTLKQCGKSISQSNKIDEFGNVIIGNDVFIGANVTILSNITIGNGAVIAAGSIVTKDIPDYAVVCGIPAKIIKYRFSKEIIEKLLKIKWWDFSNEKLQLIEQNFFDLNAFLDKCGSTHKEKVKKL